MKTLGLLGGMTWVSTLEYYRKLNEAAILRRRANWPCLVNSVDFDAISEMADRGDLDGIGCVLADAARDLEACGAGSILICTNTMHRHYDQIAAAVNVPVIHLIDAVAEEIKSKGWKKVGILGTNATMTGDFYALRLGVRHGIEAIVPDEKGREFVHDAIFQEFARNEFLEPTRRRFIEEIGKLHNRGAQAVILGCTEIPLLLKDGDARIPLIDTIDVHVRAAIAM